MPGIGEPCGTTTEGPRLKKGDKLIGGRFLRRRQVSGYPSGAVNEVIYDLSPESETWTPETRDSVQLLLNEVSAGLDDPSSVRENLGLLFIVLSRGGKKAVEIARPVCLEKIQAMCFDPRHKNERFLHRILLLLEDYAPGRVRAVTREAIHLWGDEQFRAKSGFLGTRELKERGLASSIKNILGKEIEEAGNQSDWDALKRALDLYHRVR